MSKSRRDGNVNAPLSEAIRWEAKHAEACKQVAAALEAERAPLVAAMAGLAELGSRTTEALQPRPKRGKPFRRPVGEPSVSGRVRHYIAACEGKGGAPLTLTRDGIATALEVSGGAVSKSAAWKELAARKTRAALPETTDARVLKAARGGDWLAVEKIQATEQVNIQ